MWYKKWWGILIIAILGSVLVFGLIFMRMVRSVLLEIRSEQAGQVKSASSKLNRKPAATPSKVDVVTTDDPSQGPKTAKVTVVEFSDFQCPYCAQAFPILRELQTFYRGKVRFIYRDFPIEDIHADAVPAAVAAECANEQKKFWPYHDKLFQNQSRLDGASLYNYAQQIGLEMDQFGRCFKGQKYLEEVYQDFKDGASAGVEGTPSWFINGRKVEGVIPLELFKQIIDAELNKK